MNIQDAVDVIESVSGFTDESTPVGEAWLEVLSFIHCRPTAQPKPMAASERLPKPKDCDAEGRCWWWADFDDGWILLNPKWAGGRRDSDDSPIYTHWLPANALPIPENANE